MSWDPVAEVLRNDHLLLQILLFTDPDGVLRCQRVCQAMNRLIQKNRSRMRKFMEDAIHIQWEERMQIVLMAVEDPSRIRRHLFFDTQFHSADFSSDHKHFQGEIFDLQLPYFKFKRSKDNDVIFWNDGPLTEEQKQQILKRLLAKVVERFSFGYLKLQYFDEFYDVLPVPEKLQALSVERSNFNASKLLEWLLKTEVNSLELHCRGITDPHFAGDFFMSKALQRLEKFCIFGGPIESLAINDQMILSWRSLKFLMASDFQRDVTVRGIQRLLEEWHNGKRWIETLHLIIAKNENEASTSQEVRTLLHECGRLCRGCDHTIQNANGTLLHLAVVDFSVGWQVYMKRLDLSNWDDYIEE